MGQIKIRHSVSYQADYLDIKGLNKDSNKVLKDLTNIQSLTNIEGSSHLSLLVNKRQYDTKYGIGRDKYILSDILYGLIGIPRNLFREFTRVYRVRKNIDTSFLLESKKFKYTSKTDYRKVKGRNKKVIVTDFVPLKYSNQQKEKETVLTDNIIGVVFLHTLLYDSELCTLLNYLYENKFFNIGMSNDLVLNQHKNYKEKYKKINTNIQGIIRGEQESINIEHIHDLLPYNDEDIQPKAFTIIIPVYEELDFIEPDIEIKSKRTFFKEFSTLNWTVPIDVVRNRVPIIDVFTNDGKLSNVSVNFTYFPSKLNTTYYNKYVEGMTTTTHDNFTKSPILQDCFSTIENEQNKKIWTDLNGLFDFFTTPENIISTMHLNRYSGILDNSNNDIDKVLTTNYVSTAIMVFHSEFLYGTEFYSNFIKLINYVHKTAVDSLKITAEELVNGIENINNICKQYNIKEMIPIELKNSLLHFIFYIFLVHLIENNLLHKNSNQYKLVFSAGPRSSTKTSIKINSLLFQHRYNLPIVTCLFRIIKTHTINETIDICIKAEELFFNYQKESFITFLSLNKDLKDIIQSYQMQKNTPNMDLYCKISGGDYTHFKGRFFSSSGMYYDSRNKSIEVQWLEFMNKQIAIKYPDNNYSLSKRLPEYRLFDNILTSYKGTIIRSFKANQKKEDGGDFGLFNVFRDNSTYSHILNERLSYEEHIKKITTLFETIFNFSRII